MYKISKRWSALGLLVFVLPLLAFSCHNLIPGGGGNGPGNPPPSDVDPPTGTWVLEAFRDFDALTPVLQGSEITLSFQGSTLGGSAGCNSYFGDYSTSGNTISISQIGQTEMACQNPPGVMNQEQDYTSHLIQVNTFNINGDFLNLDFDNGNRGLFFKRQQDTQTPNVDIKGTGWILEAFRELDMMILPLSITEITLVFSEDKGISGSSGCNSFFGNYEVIGNRLIVSPLITTRTGCEPDIGEQEQRFLDGLQSAETFSLDNGRLTIHYNGQDNDLIFTRDSRS
jgi:heat shock protein HslJ